MNYEQQGSTSKSILTPHQIFERIQQSILKKDPGFVDLFAEDGVHEMPFAP